VKNTEEEKIGDTCSTHSDTNFKMKCAHYKKEKKKYKFLLNWKYGNSSSVYFFIFIHRDLCLFHIKIHLWNLRLPIHSPTRKTAFFRDWKVSTQQ